MIKQNPTKLNSNQLTQSKPSKPNEGNLTKLNQIWPDRSFKSCATPVRTRTCFDVFDIMVKVQNNLIPVLFIYVSLVINKNLFILNIKMKTAARGVTTAGLVGWSILMGGLGATLVQMQTH